MAESVRDRGWASLVRIPQHSAVSQELLALRGLGHAHVLGVEAGDVPGALEVVLHGEDLGDVDSGSIGGTLFSALPYVDPRFKMMRRSAERTSGAWTRESAATRVRTEAESEKTLYSEDAYDRLADTFPDVPDLAIHAMVYPLTGTKKATRMKTA